MSNRLAQRYLRRAIEASPHLSDSTRLIEIEPVGETGLNLKFSDGSEIGIKFEMVG